MLLCDDFNLTDRCVENVCAFAVLAAEYDARSNRRVTAKRHFHFGTVIANGALLASRRCDKRGLGGADVGCDLLHYIGGGQFVTDPHAGRVAAFVACRKRREVK